MPSPFEIVVNTLSRAQRLLIITGAGCSTPSGIGDYRDERGEWKRAAPVQHQDFMGSYGWRQRYWARSQVGYPEFLRAQPNSAHFALAQMEQQGGVLSLITQNVDRLHQKAGQRNVIDLHGRLDQVVCMDCQRVLPRDQIQVYLDQNNEPMRAELVGLAPDGDADLAATRFDHVDVPSCACGGILKPDVVFYGDSVAKPLVQHCYDLVDEADAMLIVGSSLMVYSSFRFVRRARERDIPIVAVNQGVTRADGWLHAKVEGDCADVLQTMVRALA